MESKNVTKRKRHRWDTPAWKVERGQPYTGRSLDCGLTKVSECMEGTSYSMYVAGRRDRHWRHAPPCPPSDADDQQP
jgi:hypothetical protein